MNTHYAQVLFAKRGSSQALAGAWPGHSALRQ